MITDDTIGIPAARSAEIVVGPPGPHDEDRLMQLGGVTEDGPQPRTVAEAVVRGGATLGHRPAVSLLLPGGRQEQSGASLAQWAAKGAHLLELDLLFEPGDELRLDAPWSWTTAAVALAVWWAGGVVRVDGASDTAIAVIGPHGEVGSAQDVFMVGDGIDGAPDTAVHDGHESWTRAAQPFPDQPPIPRAGAELPAIRYGGRELDQRATLALAAGQGTTGPLGLQIATAAPTSEVRGAPDEPEVDAATALALVALRPLLSGHPTVVLRGAERATAAGDRVQRWARTV